MRRGEPETGSGRGVHPSPEPQVADPEAEPGQQEDTVARVVVQLLEEFDRAVDRFDDDPFVVGAAEALAFDDLAGDAVSLQVGDRFLNRAAAADPQFHQYWWSGRIPNVRYSSNGATDPDRTAMYALFIAAVSR